jgi:hypothetical protein
MTIRCVYAVPPAFPATDQDSAAVRYQVGGYWVDAVGGAPTLADVQAILSPPRRLVDKALIIDRLIAAGKADAAFDHPRARSGRSGTRALRSMPTMRKRWRGSVQSGADPTVITAS